MQTSLTGSVSDCLNRLVESGHIGHSLLLAGPPNSGKTAAAHDLAAKLLESTNPHHPDLHILRPEGKSAIHTIERLHDLAREVSLKPYQAPYKVFLIEEADRMPPASSNALLKTLEEPTDHTFICLITTNRDAILPTILSRCRTLYFPPQPRTPSLSPGRFLSHLDDFSELQAAAAEIASNLEKTRKTTATALQKQRLSKDFSAKQRELIEKEIEGEAQIAYLHAVDALFEDLLLWYRDLHLLKDDGDIRHIYHQESIPALEAWSTPLPSLSQVDKALRTTRTSIARFTKLTTCLETLFLQLV